VHDHVLLLLVVVHFALPLRFVGRSVIHSRPIPSFARWFLVVLHGFLVTYFRYADFEFDWFVRP